MFTIRIRMVSETLGSLILFIFFLIGTFSLFTGAYSFVSDSGSSINDRITDFQDIEDTSFEITSTTVSNGTTTINIRNTGENAIDIDNMYFFLDGILRSPTSTSVEFDSSRENIQPYEIAQFEFNRESSKLKIVVSNGISDSTVP